MYDLDTSTGSMKLCSVAQAGPNPSYLTFDASHRFLYTVNELKEFHGAPTGAVSAFSIDRASGILRFLNRQPSHGTDPCHLMVDKTGKYVLVANFMSGGVCVLPILKDGSLGDATDVIQHQGASVDLVRQAGPHAHSITLDETGRFVFVPDLGLDKLMVYRFDTDCGKLELNDPPWIDVMPGAGPRQLVMHPTGAFAYLINELNSTVTAFCYDRQRGNLKQIQTLSTLPTEYEGETTCAELQLSPSGKFLYGSNRGHDSIVMFAIDQLDGTLTCIGHRSTQGKTPRHFIVDPQGVFMLVANQDTDNVVTFRLDPASGEPNLTGHSIDVPTPVCVKVMVS